MSMNPLATIEDLEGREGYVTAGDGTRVRYARFSPDKPVARTLLLPGFTEFIEKHLETVAELLERGHEVLIVDWRGQGLSDRALSDRHRGYVVSMELFLSDLREVLEATAFAPRQAGEPFYVIGHSMGGHLALRAAAEMRLPFDKMIVVAPMIDIQTGHFPRRLSPILARGAVLLGMAAWYPPGAGGYDAKTQIFEGNLLTHDPVRFQRTHDQITRDPRLALGNPTFGWIDAAFRSIRRLAEPDVLARIQQPVLIFRAEREAIVSNPALERLQRQLPDARLVDLADAKHEILNETDKTRAAFWHDADIFLGE